MEWATWWDQTLARWQSEGLPAGLDRYDLYRHFGLDVWLQVWTCTVHWQCPWVPSEAPSYDDLEPYVGRWPVERATFEKGFAWQQAGDAAVWFMFPGFFWGPREILGVERHLMAFYDEPELLHRINARLADWMLAYLDELDSLGTPDFMTFAEDLSYNHGPMLSQSAFEEFLAPYYARVVPEIRGRGIRVLADSDGNIERCAPWFLAAGLEGILPLERQAGVDVDRLQAARPDLHLIGGFDKMTMPLGEEAMRAEFERLVPAMRRGRFIPSVDHQTPPSVSLQQYETYLRLLREYV